MLILHTMPGTSLLFKVKLGPKWYADQRRYLYSSLPKPQSPGSPSSPIWVTAHCKHASGCKHRQKTEGADKEANQTQKEHRTFGLKCSLGSAQLRRDCRQDIKVRMKEKSEKMAQATGEWVHNIKRCPMQNPTWMNRNVIEDLFGQRHTWTRLLTNGKI